MATMVAERELSPEQIVELFLARVTSGTRLPRAEIVQLSRAVMAVAGRVRPRQGGYSAKKEGEHLAKDHMPNTFPPELKREPSAAQRDRMDNGIVYEAKVGDLLDGVDGVVVIAESLDEDGNRTNEGKQAKEEATWAAYRDPAVRFIFNARLGGVFAGLVSQYLGVDVDDDARISEPDAIELGPVMGNGLRAMRFIDVKWHKTTSGQSANPTVYGVSSLAEPFFDAREDRDFYGAPKIEDWLQLSHYYRHGQSLRVVDADASLWGAVIGKEEVLVWARLDANMFMRPDPETGRRRRQSPLDVYDRAFAEALEVVENAIARDLNPAVPALTFPELTDECKESEWHDVCLAELLAHGDGGHITLLPGITAEKAKPFYAAGITDINTLARLDPDDHIEGVRDLRTAVYQARVASNQKVARAPEVEVVDMPRAAIEIDFDYEADHVVYQRGVRATGRRRKPNGDFRQRVEMNIFDDFTGTEEGEMRVFVEMWAYFQAMIALAKARRHSIRFYHYSRYERVQDVRLAEKYAGQPGVPTVEEVSDFYASDMVVDLLEVFSKQLVWPTRSHSIKDLAKFVRFSWSESGQNGAESMVWYRTAISHPDENVRAEEIARLRDYNTSDCAAQVALKDWVSALGEDRRPGSKIQAVESIKPPIKVTRR